MIQRFIYTASLIIMILLFSPVHAFSPPEENGMDDSAGAGTLCRPIGSETDDYEASRPSLEE